MKAETQESEQTKALTCLLISVMPWHVDTWALVISRNFMAWQRAVAHAGQLSESYWGCGYDLHHTPTGLAISDAFDAELAEVHHIAWKELRDYGQKPASWPVWTLSKTRNSNVSAVSNHFRDFTIHFHRRAASKRTGFVLSGPGDLAALLW